MRKSIYLLKTTPSSHTHRFHPLPLDTPTSCSPHPLAREKKRASSRRHYSTNREKKRTYSRKQYSDNPSKKKAAAHAYLALNRDNVCAQKRAKYVLAEPKPDVKHM